MFARSPILGRQRELATLNRLVDGLSERGASLVVTGEPGIGKSVLLGAAMERAKARGMRVLSTTGVRSEAELPFAGLHHLVMPILERVDRLPPPQKAALLTAFGTIKESPPERLLIGLAVLELISGSAENAPLLILADDAQWIDPSSAGILAFVARRVEHEPVGMLVALREGTDSVLAGAELPELRLSGLDEDAAGRLLSLHGRLAPVVKERLLQEAEGNPLALVELPASLAEDEISGRAPLPALLPLSERLEQAFVARVAEMPHPTRTLLLLAAANDGGTIDEITAAASKLIHDAPQEEDLAPAIAARLARFDGTRLELRHPLVRSAVYQRATLVERSAAHSALAEMLAEEPDRQVWHRAASLVGADEGVAKDLEEAAVRARGRGAIGVAVQALERAAQLSRDGKRRGRRLLDAAEVASELGRREAVLQLVNEAEQVGLAPVDSQRAMLIQEAFDTGEDTASMGQIIAVAEQTWHRDSDFALNVLRRAAGKSWWVGRSEERRQLLAEAVDRMGLPESNPQRLAIIALIGSGEREREVLEILTRSTPGASGDPIAARLLGLAGYAVGHLTFAVDALTVAIAGLRAHGRLALLAQAIVARASASVQLGRLDLAVTDAEEGYRLSVETGQPLFAEYARAALSLLAGMRGDVEEAEAISAAVERTMVPLQGKAVLWDVQLARGITALGDDQHTDAYEQLARTFDPNDPAEHFRKKYWAVGDLAEAALQSDRHDEARAVLERSEAALGDRVSPRVRVSLEYARPLLAEEDEAEALYVAGLRGDLASWPFARARLLLAYGIWLRRQRRIMDSRPHISAAKGTFEALGVTPWAERARRELRAAGVLSQRRARGGLDDLTAQELQVARLAASGLSNREIGQRLFLSHRTVGTHLYRAFPKLGITSRGQLRDALP